MAVAVVAIPSKDDYVWKLSSEKVPHITLLYLDDQINNLTEVLLYIQHAVNVTLTRFGLLVDRRDILGDQLADVIFFDQQPEIETLKDFRTHLLANTDILSAYNRAEQFPQWIPHLTMGYPETPAKPDNRDYPGTSWVKFDRIAVWTGDYEGVEFPLKTDVETDVAMTVASGANFLEHYGIKGMKWGVHRFSKEERARRRAARPGGGKGPSEDATAAKGLTNQGKNSGRDSLSNQELRKLTERWNLEQSYERLRPRSAASKASMWIAKALFDIGKDQAKAYARDAVGDAVKGSKS